MQKRYFPRNLKKHPPRRNAKEHSHVFLSPDDACDPPSHCSGQPVFSSVHARYRMFANKDMSRDGLLRLCYYTENPPEISLATRN
ncbi:hypothetical protein AVEN_264873-1 [Araneus ventricosus]|uniref:Uncharacterized protein n=1 Tax=Araneus ventricosus TaxID=182803 RepID=A0A4Y2GTP8_ARAVE|nr:hypothetical protein AVEN_264873-1 [Araneus ventricosus]